MNLDSTIEFFEKPDSAYAQSRLNLDSAIARKQSFFEP